MLWSKKRYYIRFFLQLCNDQIKDNSYDSLSLDKTLTFPNVIMYIKSVLSKDESRYYYTTFL